MTTFAPFNDLGPFLRQARLRARQSQQQFADMFGISKWTYNRLEKGHRKFDTEWLPYIPQPVRKPITDHLAEILRGKAVQLEALGRVPFKRGNRRQRSGDQSPM